MVGRAFLSKVSVGVVLVVGLVSGEAWCVPDFPLPPICQGQAVTPQNVMDPTQTPLHVLLHYRAPNHQYDNAFGDIALIRYALNAPWGLYWVLSGHPAQLSSFKNWIMSGKPCALALYQLADREVPQVNRSYRREPLNQEVLTIRHLPISAERQQALLTALRNHQLFFQGNRSPIRRAEFVHMVEQIVDEVHEQQGIEPQLGAEPEWSKRMLWSLKPEYAPVLLLPKLLVALTIGESSRYLTTGQESPLLSWILASAIRSIEPYDLLKQSYILNRGNMLDTLLTIENVLSRHWHHPQRERLEQTLRLKPVTNQFGDDRNVFGTWYHFFGLVLYGYAHPVWQGAVIGQVETIGSQILNHFADEEGETQMNNVGALVGGDIRKVLTSQSWKHRFRSLDYSRETQYMDLNQSFARQLMSWKPSTPAPAVSPHLY